MLFVEHRKGLAFFLCYSDDLMCIKLIIKQWMDGWMDKRVAYSNSLSLLP